MDQAHFSFVTVGWKIRIVVDWLKDSFAWDRQQGRAGFVICSKFRKIKTDLKKWLADFEKQKCGEEFLLKDIERKDQMAEFEEVPSFEEDLRVALKAELLASY